MCGAYVLVEFDSGKNLSYSYVCCIQIALDNDEEVKIMALKSTDNRRQHFQFMENDISYVSYNKILGILPPPQMVAQGRKFLAQFAKPVNVHEIDN